MLLAGVFGTDSSKGGECVWIIDRWGSRVQLTMLMPTPWSGMGAGQVGHASIPLANSKLHGLRHVFAARERGQMARILAKILASPLVSHPGSRLQRRKGI